MQRSNCELLDRRASVAADELFPAARDSDSAGWSRASLLRSSCRICLSGLRRPAALTCGHRFCERCLDQYWHVADKPDAIVCPLCRALAFNVHFAKSTQEDKGPSSEDFRRTFRPVLTELDLRRAVSWCLKVSALTPALYFLLKWLQTPIVQLCKQFYLTLASKM